MTEESEDFFHHWEAESLRYFSLPERPYSGAVLLGEVSKLLGDENLDSVLDVGCGNGSFLSKVLKQLSIPAGMGVEPSKATVERLKSRWAKLPELSFEVAAAERLPFPDRSFDLVVAWSVLHWISREHYLQALGEMVRVANKYLLVMDFCPLESYRTPYKHRGGWFTYKADFDVPLSGTDILERLIDIRFIDGNTQSAEKLSKSDLEPLLGNWRNWSARRCVLYGKSLQMPQVFLEGDFL